jgi:hypothetical protein
VVRHVPETTKKRHTLARPKENKTLLIILIKEIPKLLEKRSFP